MAAATFRLQQKKHLINFSLSFGNAAAAMASWQKCQ